MSSVRASERYLLTVQPEGGAIQKRIWDGRQSVALGHPFRWVLERTENGVRVRSLTGPLNKTYSDGVEEVTDSKLKDGCEIKVAGGTLRLFPVHDMPAPFAVPANQTGELSVFFCLANCVVATSKLGDSFKAKVNKKKVFAFARASDGVKVTANVEGVEVHSADAPKKLAKGESVVISTSQLTGTNVHYGTFNWYVRPVPVPKFSLGGKFKKPGDEETKYFKKTVARVFAALAVFMVTALLWPKPDPKKEELIPEQFAKLVMSKPIATAKEAAAPTNNVQPEAKTPDSEAPKKVAKAKNAAVVQAFRAKALQNAVSGLLRGGMTQLLSQSEMLTGAEATKAARRVLDGKATPGLAAAPVVGLTGARNVDVSMVGGASDKGGIGYGKGQRAGVSGQGKSFVTLDLGNAEVEEGLSKDEVGRVIHAHMSEIRYCYESSMLSNSEIEGRVVLDFVIGPNGVIKTARAKETTTGDPKLDDCVVRRLTKWQFPKPKGGVNVSVSYPFIFKTLGR